MTNDEIMTHLECHKQPE